MRVARQILEALLLGAATYAGVKAMQELTNPYSGARLRASEIAERLREVSR